jgi:hypothetical protein
MTLELRQKNLQIGLLLLAVFGGILLRVPSLDLPLDRDEGEYATLAFAWLHGHGLIYRDFLEQKPPLAALIYALPQFFGFASVTALRVTALLWQALSVSALFFLALRLSSSGGLAFMAALLYGILSSGARTQGLSANTELFVALPMLGALWAGRRWFLAGVLIGLAGLAKQSALPAALVLPLLLEPGSFKARGLALLRCLAGACLPWLLCLLLFSMVGAGAAFLNCVFIYNFAYVSQGWKASLEHLYGALRWISREQGLLWLGVPYALWRALKEQDRSYDLALAWLLSALLGVSLSGRYYPHYFQIALAPLALIAALAWKEQEGLGPKRLSWVWLGLFALQFTACNLPLWTASNPGQKSLRLFRVETFAAAPTAAEWISAHTPEDSRLWIWGSEAELYFLSRRAPATRFLFHYPFSGEAPAWPGGDKELKDGLLDPRTQAAVLSEPLSNRELMEIVLKNYTLRTDVAPPYWIGLRKH